MRNQRMKISGLHLCKTIVSLALALMLMCGNLSSVASGMWNAYALEDTETPASTKQVGVNTVAAQPTKAPTKVDQQTGTLSATETHAATLPVGSLPTVVPAWDISTSDEDPGLNSSEVAPNTTYLPADDLLVTEVPAEDGAVAQQPATTDAPAEDVQDIQLPETEAPAMEPLVSVAPIDERTTLQRAIEDEDGAYVNVQHGDIFEDENLNTFMGVLDSGLAFATNYVVQEDGRDSICVIFRTSDDSLLTGFILASHADELDRQQTVNRLFQNGDTFLFCTSPELPLSVIGFQFGQDEATETPAPAQDENTTAVVEDVEPYEAVTVLGSVNLRRQPSVSSELLKQLEQGSSMTVHGRLTNEAGELWYAVTYNQMECYVLAELVEAVAAEETPAAAEETEAPADTEEPMVAENSFVSTEYTEELPPTVTTNGDGFYTYIYDEGTSMRLVYGSVDGGDPAFYAVDENQNILLDKMISLEELTQSQSTDQVEVSAPQTFVSMAYEGDLTAVISANEDGTYFYTSEDGTITSLVYGSVDGAAPAFYAVDESGVPNLSASFEMMLEASNEAAALPSGFTPIVYEGTLPVEIVLDGGTYLYTAADGTVTTVVYGSVEGGEPGFYPVDESGMPILTAPMAVTMVQQETDIPVTAPAFVPMSPSRLPDGYSPVGKPASKQDAWSWLFASACAEEEVPVDYGTVYEFKVKNGDIRYRVFGSLYGNDPCFYAFDIENNTFLLDEVGKPIAVDPMNDISDMYTQDIATAVRSQIEGLPALEVVRAMAAGSAELNAASIMTEQVRKQMDDTLAQLNADEQSQFRSAIGEAAQTKIDTLVAYFAQLVDQVPQDNTVVFVPITPDADVVPYYYQRIEVTSINTAGKLDPWGWLFASACAEETKPENEWLQQPKFELEFYYQAAEGVYRAYGSLNNGDAAFYAYDPETNTLIPPYEAVDPWTDDGQYAISTLSEGVEQSLVVNFLRGAESYKAGAVMYMQLDSSLSSVDQAAYSNVYIEVPNITGLTMPQFDNNNTYQFNGVTIQRITEGGKTYLKYHLNAGDTISGCFIKVTLPNGTTPNGTVVNFAVDEAKTAADTTADITSIPAKYTVSNPTVTAEFGWNDINITALPTQTSFTSEKKVKDAINYAIFAVNKFTNRLSGVIYTESYTMTGAITLPTGLSFPAGSATLSDGNKTLSIGGVTIATFSLPLASCSVSGQTINYAYALDNSALTSDTGNLDLNVRLEAGNLIAGSMEAFTGSEEITHTVTFHAIPCLNVGDHNSNDAAATTIIKPKAELTLTKTAAPGSSEKIYSTDKIITYTLKVENTGSVGQTIKVTDAIPENTRYFEDSTHTPTTGMTKVPATGTVTSVEWNPTVAAGGSATFVFYVKPAENIANGTVITNQAEMKDQGGVSVGVSNTVRNTYDNTDSLTLFKATTNATPLVGHNDIAEFTISLTNNNKERPANKAHTISDTLGAGLYMTQAQKDAFTAAYPGYTITFGTNETGNETFTISPVSLAVAETKSFTYKATITGKKTETIEFENNDAIINRAEVKDNGDLLESSVTLRYNKQIQDVKVTKTNSPYVQITRDTFHIDYKLNVVNNGASTASLPVPMSFRDQMHAIWPVGADPNAALGTTGTMTGVDSKGATVTGTWTVKEETAQNQAIYNKDRYYEVIWTIPTLETKEEYSITYTVEAKVTLDADENFVTQTVGNDVFVYEEHSGTINYIRRAYTLNKSITRVNSTDYTPPTDFCEVYPGDKVQYTIKVTYRNVANQVGKMVDYLPEIKAGSGFAWSMDGENANVKIIESGSTGPMPNKLENGLLYWDSIPLTKNNEDGTTEHLTTLTWVVEVDFPEDKALFTKAFGDPQSTFSNKVAFTCEAENVYLRDHVDHEIRFLALTTNKTVDKSSVDSAATEDADRTVVFTIDDFGFDHSALDVSLLEALSDVRNHFDIKAIDMGSLSVTNEKDEAIGYTVDFIFSEDGLDSVSVPVAIDGTPTFPADRKIADVVAVRWDFGSKVHKLTVNNPIKVTCVARSEESGRVTNTVSIGFNGEQMEATATTRAINSNMLTKVLLDKDGNVVNNKDNMPEAEKTYTNKIVYSNFSEDERSCTELNMFDSYRYQGLDQSDFVVKVEHVDQYGQPAADPAMPNTFTFDYLHRTPGSTGIENGQIYFTFTSGTFKPGDTITITYDVTTSKDFNLAKKDDANTAKYTLTNTVYAIDPTIGAGNLTAGYGPYYPKSKVSVYMQVSLVGEGRYYDKSDGYNYNVIQRTQEHYFESTPEVSLNYPSTAPALFYNITIANSTDSTQTIILPADSWPQSWTITNSTGTASETAGSNTTPVAQSEHFRLQYLDTYHNSRIELVQSVNASTVAPTGLGNNLHVPDGYTIVRDYLQNTNQGGLVTSPLGTSLEPGDVITYYMAATGVDAANDWKSPLNAMNHASDITYESTLDLKNLGLPEGTEINMEPVDLQLYGIENSVVTVGDTWLDEDSVLHSAVSIASKPRKLGISKSYVGYYTNDEMETAYSQPNNSIVYDPFEEYGMTPHSSVPIETNSYIVFDIKLENLGDGPITDGVFTETLPEGYELVWAGIKESDLSIFSCGLNIGGYEKKHDNPNDVKNIVDEINNNTPWDIAQDLSSFKIDMEWNKGYGIVGPLLRVDSPTNYQFANRLRSIFPGDHRIIRIVMRPKDSSKIDYTTYVNTAKFVAENDAIGGTTPDVVKYVGRGETVTEEGYIVGALATAELNMGGALATESFKTVTQNGVIASSKDANKVITVDGTQPFRYTLNIKNRSDTNLSKFVIIDRMPEVGDKGVINTAGERNSEFLVQFNTTPNVKVSLCDLDGNVLTDDITGWFNISYTVHDKTTGFSDQDWAGTSAWSSEPQTGSNAIRLAMKDGNSLSQNNALQISYDAIIPGTVRTGLNGTEIAYNNFAYSYFGHTDQLGDKTILAEPGKVGVKVGGVKLALYKTDVNNAALGGAIFSVYDNEACTGTPIATLTSDSTGYAITDTQIPLGYTCYVKETYAPSGKLLSTAVHTVTIPATAAQGSVYNVANSQVWQDTLTDNAAIVNLNAGAFIAISKRSALGSLPLAGAVFGVYDNALCTGAPTATLTTALTEDGKSAIAITTAALELKTWYVKEITAPTGYQLSTTVHDVYLNNFRSGQTVNAANNTLWNAENTSLNAAITNPRDTVTVWLTKIMANGVTAPTENITLTLSGVFDGSTSVVDKRAVFRPTEIGAVPKSITGVIPGNEYTLTEAGSDYMLTATATDADGAVTISTDGKLTINKTTFITATNNKIPGATMKLKKHIDTTNGGVYGGEAFTVTVSGVFSDSVNGARQTKTFVFSGTPQTGEYALETEIDVPGVLYNNTYIVTETAGGDFYTTTYQASVGGGASTDLNNGSLTLGTQTAVVTVVNKPFNFDNPGQALLFIGKQSADPNAAEKEFTVAISGDFAQGDSTVKWERKTVVVKPNAIDPQSPGQMVGVSGLIPGKRYTISEVLSTGDSAKYDVTYSDLDKNPILDSSGNVLITTEVKNVVVHNNLRSRGQITVYKNVEANTLSRIETYTFTLTGPEGINYVGTAETASRAQVQWTNGGAPVQLTDLPFGDYTLTETQQSNSSYQLKGYKLNDGELQTDATLTFTLGQTNAVVVAEAVNEVKKGSITVTKSLIDHLGNPGTKASTTGLAFALYQQNSQSPVAGPTDLVWNDSTKKYNSVSFTGLPYGDYVVRELVKNADSTYSFASETASFPYTITNDGATVTLNGNTTAADQPTITNTERFATATITANKEFENNSDEELLRGRTFVIRLTRQDGGLITATGATLDLNLSYDKDPAKNWKTTLTDVKLAAGVYNFEEITTNAQEEGWQNVALSGIADSGEATITGGGDDPWQGSFTVGTDALGQPIQIVLNAKNKATSKKLRFELNKAVDSLNVPDPDKDLKFSFTLTHDGNDVAKGTITKTMLDAETVTWVDMEDNAFDPNSYLWEIGDKYQIKESSHTYYQLTAIRGSGVEELSEGEGADRHLVGASFTVSEGLNVVNVTFANNLKTVSGLKLQKKVLNGDTEVPVANWLTGSNFEFGLYNSSKTLIGTLNLSDGNAVALTADEAIVLGGTYYIKELSVKPEGAYTLKRFTGAGGTALTADTVDTKMFKFTAEADLTLVAENNINPNSLSISKAVVGGEATDEFTFSVLIAGANYSGSYIVTNTDGTGTPVTMKTTNGNVILKNGQTATIYGITAGATYNVTENQAGGYATTVKVGTGTPNASLTAQGNVNGAVSVAYTNTRALLNATLSKNVSGNAGDREKAFTFTVYFRQKDEAHTPLAAGTKIDIDPTGGAELTSISLDADGKASFTLKHGQSLTFKELNKEWEMQIEEADYISDGYATSYTDSKKGSNNARSTGWIPLSEAAWVDGAYETRSFAYTNNRNIQVPTGIATDVWPYLLTLLVSLTGGILLVVNRFRRKARKSSDR